MNRNRPSRRGWAIIEMLLVIGALSIILGLCAGLLHVLLRLQRSEQSHLGETASLARLARQLRNDVHAATRSKLDDDDREDHRGLKLELMIPDDRVIAYQAGPRLVVRTQHHGAELERRESYALPFCPEPRFLKSDSPEKVWVTLRLPRGDRGRNEPDPGPKRLSHDLRIDVLLGKDHLRPPSKETTP